jgi:histidinol-phosphate aminotransferase
MRYIKKSVVELAEYHVLQDEFVVKLNQNESPYDFPGELKQKVLNKLNEIHWNRYPCGRTSLFIDVLSNYINYPGSGIIVGCGSNEMIHTVFSSICDKGDSVAVISPGFSIYPRLAKIMGLEIIEIPLLEDFGFDISSIINYAKKAKILILASPNNPTGTALNIEEIEEIARNMEGWFVIDEAYNEFYKKTALGLLDDFENLIIIRTFSKAFGLAGIRLGYMLARPEVAKEIQKAKLPFSVGSFQQIAGMVVTENNKYVKEIVDEIIGERERLFSELDEMASIYPIPSFANFILFKVKSGSAKDVFETMYKRGVLLRHFETERLKSMLRVTIGKPKENEIFLAKLKEILGD